MSNTYRDNKKANRSFAKILDCEIEWANIAHAWGHETPDYSEIVEESGKHYAKQFRDGYYNSNSSRPRKSQFRKEANKQLRLANKRLECKIMKGKVYDDISYPSRKESKYLVWHIL